MTTAAMLALLASACAVAAGPVAGAVPRPDPRNGDGGVPAFYHWTGDVPAKAGRLLRSEPLPANLSLANAAKAARFLYTSRDAATRRPTVVSGAIFVPQGTPPAGGWPLIAWAHGTTGLADVCAPSTYPRSPRDTRYLNSWLAAGFAIVSSDYQGLGTPGPHPYTDFRSHAYAVLDSIRAVPRADLHIADNVVLLGQSQGAGTVVAAAGYAPEYAPDVNLLGTVATGVPNMTREAITAGVPSSATDRGAAIAFVAMATELHQAKPDVALDQMLTPAGAAYSEQLNSKCYGAMLGEAEKAQLDPATVLQPGALKRIFAYNLDHRSYPALRLAKPLFVGIGATDTTTIASGAKALVKQLCAAGTLVQAHLYTGQDHSGAVNVSAPDGIAFARKLVAGERPDAVCDPEPQG